MKEKFCFVCGKAHRNGQVLCNSLMDDSPDPEKTNTTNLSVILDESPVECKSIFDNTSFMFNPGMNFSILSTPTYTE